MKTKRRSWKLPSAKTDKALMRKIAGSSRRVHTLPEYEGKCWVESRWCRRGWWSVLWPWPDWRNQFIDREHVVQFPGMTLPVYCSTREQAVDWAWTLATMKESGAKWTVRRGYAA